MYESIHPAELLRATEAIKGFVDTHDHKPFVNELGEYAVYATALESPRVINDRTANFIRVFKGLSGIVIAGAQYTECGLEPNPKTGIAQEMPLRHITISAETAPIYSFNGGGMDARDYPLTPRMLAELLEDIVTSR